MHWITAPVVMIPLPFLGRVSHGESEGRPTRPSPSLYKTEMRDKDAKAGKDGSNYDEVVEDWEEHDTNSSEVPPDMVSLTGHYDDRDGQHQNLENFDAARSHGEVLHRLKILLRS